MDYSMPKKGYKQTEEHKAELKRNHKGMSGLTHSEKSKEKMRKVFKGKLPWNTGKHLSEKHKANIGKSNEGKHHSLRTEKSKQKMSESRIRMNCKGNKAPNWKGGITPIHLLIRESIKYNEWRLGVFKKNNFTCQKCGQIGGYLEAHHIKSFSRLFAEARRLMPLLNSYDAAMVYSPLWDVNNGKTLCGKCHNKTKKKLGGL